ncbi:MAG TPA: endonuclease NucS domain-containing protein [Longimicrobium sp.]|nr:endonuclease NucS domain-containing protein [Longimicrobium sp.]
MSRIRIWKVEQTDGLRAAPLDAVRSSETERLLEDILVASPDLLQDELVLVGRQVPTAGGPLDLLGIDADGRLVVFELKRGVLTREAIAQVLDYASDLATMDLETLGRLVEESSRRPGLPQIANFLEWYGENYAPDTAPLKERPRMVLVGLGVDERALRVVNFLAETGVPIQLLTFHAFSAGGEMLLAKQVESEPVSAPASTGVSTKEGNRRSLLERAHARGVGGLLEEVAQFVRAQLPGAYVWPHKTLYTFNVADETSEGRATQRFIVSLGPHEQREGTLRLAFPERALELGADVERMMTERLGGRRVNTGSRAMEVLLTAAAWPSAQEPLREVLSLIRHRWDVRRLTRSLGGPGDDAEPSDGGPGGGETEAPNAPA